MFWKFVFGVFWRCLGCSKVALDILEILGYSEVVWVVLEMFRTF